MEKFFVLYLAPVSSIEEIMSNFTPEQMKASMDEWGKWMKDHEANFVDMGAPLGKTKRVTSGRVSDTKNEVTGYSIVQAESHDAAAQLFVDHPHLQIPNSYIDIVKVGHVPGM